MTDGRCSRRRALRTVGLTSVAGAAWATPAIRNLRLGAAPGSPPPASTTSSTTTTTEPSRIVFSAPVSGTIAVSANVPPNVVLGVSMTGDLGALGTTILVFGGVNPFGGNTFNGTFDLPANGGSLTGTFDAVAQIGSGGPGTWHVTATLVVTGGSGAYAGATGTMQLNAEGSVAATGTLSGDIDLT
jgi:hypothetical protein